MRSASAAVLLAAILILAPVSFFAAPPAKDQSYARVLASIRDDPSFKVRLQAIRVLVKQLKASGAPPSDEVFAVLAKAAESDDEKLVRGLACFAMGELADRRAHDPLVRAQKDPDAFVRAQADEALKAVEKMMVVASAPADAGAAAGDASKRRVLVIATELAPGVETPPELSSALASALGAELTAQAHGYTIVSGAQGFGYKLSGIISERTLATEGDGSNKVTLVVRITISTVPENNLRHVMTAKASAASKSAGPAFASVEQKVLRAAVSRAVKDSLAAISVE